MTHLWLQCLQLPPTASHSKLVGFPQWGYKANKQLRDWKTMKLHLQASGAWPSSSLLHFKFIIKSASFETLLLHLFKVYLAKHKNHQSANLYDMLTLKNRKMKVCDEQGDIIIGKGGWCVILV